MFCLKYTFHLKDVLNILLLIFQFFVSNAIIDFYIIIQVKLQEKQTSAPDYLTEADLISLMEKHGIGTDASIPVHINNISERNYVNVTGGRRLKPTNLGIVLIHGYQKVIIGSISL